MRKPFWAVVTLSLWAACGDDDASNRHASETADAGSHADAGNHVDAGIDIDIDVATAPLMDVVRYEISLYDRRIRAVCPCLVAKGEYDSVDDCLKLGLSSPDWLGCETTALASYDNPMTRAQTSCYYDFLKQTAECVEAAQCDDTQLGNCGTPDADCLTASNERLQIVITACPSFGLLSRLQ